MALDSIALYDMNTVRKWHNEWLGYLLQLRDKRPCDPTPLRPSIPFSVDECERELIRRYTLELEEF